MAPRANVADIARRNDILPQQLYAWRREARERMESDDAPAFVPAMVEEPKAGNGAEIRINIKGMTIRIPDGVTADHIERVLLAVQVST
jgi:transposase